MIKGSLYIKYMYTLYIKSLSSEGTLNARLITDQHEEGEEGSESHPICHEIILSISDSVLILIIVLSCGLSNINIIIIIDIDKRAIKLINRTTEKT